MPDIIQSWLGRKLGVMIDMSPDNFGRNVKDGKLLAKLLYSYGIITPEILDCVKSAKYVNECYNNLIILKPWLEFLTIPNLDSTLKDLSCGNGSAAIQLFYALYLNLENKGRLQLLLKQKERNFFEGALKREVKVDWVPEMEIKEETMHFESNLALPLIEKNNIIKWHKEKCLDVARQIKEVKKKFAETVEKSEVKLNFSRGKKSASKKVTEVKETRENINCFERKYYQETPDLNYEELLELKGKVQALPPIIPNLNEAKNYINFIKQRSKKNMSERMFQKKMSSLMAEEMLKNLIEKQENEFDDKVVQNLLKQSQYEKQMCTKLFLIRHQKKVLAENRSMIDKLILNEREKEFIEVLNKRLDSKSEEAGDDFFEKERIRELHRRMYGEKAKLKGESNLKECQRILNSLIDISIRCAEYRETHDCCVPKHLMKDMKELFFKNLPIFDILENVEMLHEKPESYDNLGDLMFSLEQERQDVLDECDFDDYLHLLGPWMIELLSPDEKNEEVEQFLLGYIVYKLLEMKYPKPSVPVPADIKPMYPRSVVRELNDEKAKEMLIDLLSLKQILLVNVDDAINFVLVAYKEELSVVRDIDINFQKATKASLKDKESERTKKSKKEELLKKETTEKIKTSSIIELSKEQETQTPRRIPEDDPDLSPNAEIGKIAFECLGLGETIPDSVIVSAIVAYVIAKQNDYQGWVLLNYPLTYSQASKLETALTGIKLPPVEEEQGKGRRRSSVKETVMEDVFASMRVSRLVPNPIKPEPYAAPKTYFSSFIKIQKKAEGPKNALENFYADRNIFRECEAPAMNFQCVKDLGKLILEEPQQRTPQDEDSEVLPPKTSLEIFGNELVELNDKYAPKKKETKKASPKVVTAKKSGSIVKSKSKSKSLSKEPSVESKDKKIDKTETPKPGDPDYPWIPPTQSEEILSALADFWINMETIYVEDFKQIFFCLRVHYSTVAMYTTFVKNLLRTFMRRPDDKASLINEFQLMYNNIDQDLRPNVDVKYELHSRVHKFQSTLLELADIRKTGSEEERKKIINDLWVCDEMSCLINYYALAMQLECSRCIDTCQIINDYYLTLEGRLPEEKRSTKVLIPRLQISDRKYSVISEASGKSSGSVASKRRKSSENSVLINGAESIVSILTDLTMPRDNLTPFHLFFNEIMDEATKEMSGIVENLIAQSKKSEKPKEKKKTGEKSLDFGNQIATEWTAALEDELKRFLFRSKLIKIRGLIDIDELISIMYETFLLLFEEVGETYVREVQSVLNCCKIFRCAIEEELPIPYQLELNIDKFVINKEVLFFEPQKKPSVRPLAEKPSDLDFSMEQLFNLCEKLRNVAPEGEIIRRSFIYILEDLRVIKSEEDILPRVWDFISPDEITTIFDKIYQRLEIVCWKDFMIYAMDLPFPTESEILWMRDQFRQFDYECRNLIHIDDFKKIDFWFVLNTEKNYRTLQAKEFLFTLFAIDDHFVNYYSLLLAFCKDQDPAVGFAKGLALTCGKKIVVRNFDPDLLSEEEKLEMANEIVTELVSDVMQGTDGILLKEIHEYNGEESKIFSSEPPKSSVSYRYGETEGESYDYFKETETATSVVTSEVVSTLILSSYPSLRKLSILLNCERTLEETLKDVYGSLTRVNEKFQVYHLLQNDFIFRLLNGTNKFKTIRIGPILTEMTRRNTNN